MDIMDILPKRLPRQITTAAVVGGLAFAVSEALSPPNETAAQFLGHNTTVDVCDSEMYSLGQEASAKQLGDTACGQFKGSFKVQETTVTVYAPANNGAPDPNTPPISQSSIYLLPKPHTFREANYVTPDDVRNDNTRDKLVNALIGVMSLIGSFGFMKTAQITDPRRRKSGLQVVK